jgi:alpha-1,2-mannosyltransferase
MISALPTTDTPSPALPPAWSVSRVVALALFGVSVVWWAYGLPLGVDSAVYRSGALAVVNGEALYGHLLATPDWSPDLPFTYPPIAALLFVPLAWVPAQIAWGLLAVPTALSLGLVVRLATGAAATSRALPLLLPLLALEPVWRTIGLGQVNVVLMAMVVVDVLVLRGTRFSGILIGLAAAIKLTPLVFVLHLVVTRRWADALRAVGTFTASVAVGLVVLTEDAVRYWTSTLFGANDAMSNAWSGNQSLNGAIRRVAGEVPWSTALLVVLAVGCVVAAAVMARAVDRRGDALGALTVTAFCGLLVSPISWTHHWVWLVLPCCLLVRHRRWAAAGAVVLVFSGWTFASVPRGDDRELAWTPVESLVGNAHVIGVLVAGAVLAVHLVRTRRDQARLPSTTRDRPYPR